MKFALALAVTVITIAPGCGDDGNHGDAQIIGDGPCGADNYFTGEVVDWDETEVNFCGVFNAKLTVEGDTSRTDMSNPNGRFELCIARTATTRVNLTPPTGASQCNATVGLYQIPGILIANQAVIATGKAFSARMIGMNRLTPFFEALGVVYDPAKATVFVHVEGTPHAVTSSAAHDTTLAWSGTAWAAGDTGVNVVFPNTDVAGGTTMVGVGNGTAVGTGSVPVVAGTFTYVTIVGN